MEKQIVKACHKQGIADCSDFAEIITFYYGAYMRTFHREHPRLSAKAMDGVISALCSGPKMVEDIHPETYKTMIERHFQTEYGDCDYNICHFMTEGVRNNCFYETCYFDCRHLSAIRCQSAAGGSRRAQYPPCFPYLHLCA